MTLLPTVGLPVAYGLVGLVTARMVAGHLAWTFHRNNPYHEVPQPDGEQWFWGWCCGILAGVIWPLVVLLALLPTRSGRWAVGEERRAVQRAQAERIRQLERELGLDR